MPAASKQSLDKTELFAHMPVRQAVLRQVLPAVASQMITLIYNLADTYFVGQLNDPYQTAAITVATAAFVMLTAISNLFGIGGAGAIASSLGKKQSDKARQIASLSFWGGLGCAISFSALFALLARPILHLCGATAETYAYAYGYARWVVILGGPFTILNTLLANLVRAEGNASAASFGVSFGGVLNILLDPFFVLPQFLGMGAVGAGIATALSNMAATLFFLGYLLARRNVTVLSLAPGHLRHARAHLKPILSVGFPSAMQYALTVAANAALMKFISGYSAEAVAAVGIVKKLDQLPLFFSIGVANGLLPLLAFNHAAGDHRRRSQAFRFGTMIALGFSLFCVIVYEIFAPSLTALFIDDTPTLAYSAVFLRQAVLAMPMVAICYPMIIQFQAMRQVKEAMISSLLRKGLLDIPLLFLMDAILPLYGCIWVQPIVDSVSLIAVLIFYARLQNKQRTARPEA